MVPAHAPAVPPDPFMSAMDEISYWVYTKRAPCLMNYDNAKRLSEQAQCSMPKPEGIPCVAEVPSPKKKRKRKLSLLDEDSVSDIKANVYFDTSLKQKKVVPSCESDTLRSDIEFNIRNTTRKTKKPKLQKTRTPQKKNKVSNVVTSTPNVSTLRRSARQACRSHNISQLNSSFDILDTSIINGNHKNSTIELKTPEKLKKSTDILAGRDKSVVHKRSTVTKVNKPKNEVLNGQFEDLSDVSGFTANYIKSTKIQSKTPSKMRCKNNRNLVKESRQSAPRDNSMMANSKTIHTASKPAILNYSTDSENIINIVRKSNDKSKTATLLTESRNYSKKDTSTSNLESSRRKPDTNLNTTDHSQTPSRYPKRYRNHTLTSTQDGTIDNTDSCQIDSKRRTRKNSNSFNHSDRKENKRQIRRNAGVSRHLRSNKSVSLKKDLVSLQKDSVRDKSGFAACFSDSDDSEPLQKKFFCA